jgi:hypothetical protein
MNDGPRKDYDKFLDLEGSEYRRSEDPEPFWGFAAKPVIVMFLAAFPVSAVVTYLVTGQFPYWTMPVLELLSPPF